MSLDPSAQHNSLAPQVARQFDKICDQFEADWKAGRRPRIDVLVYDFAEPDRSVLLRDLLAIDLEYRRTNGETPKAERYLQRFPEHAAVIRQVFADFDSGKSHGLETAATRAENAEVSETRGVGAGFELPKAVVSGKKLGRFELIEVVGQGAFGTVHRARDPQLDRDVAIKVPRSGVLVEQQDVARFLREAKASAQLRHPNIVAVYEAGRVDHTYFIASAFVQGTTLRQAVKEGRRFSHEQVAKMVSQLASALHYAHTKGVIHRDVKPGNIMLDELGEPHIMDFGLARRIEGDALRTMEGVRLGTPAYMSPEQAQGQSHLADARTDVWSLGVILYELLVGKRPFEGSETEVLLAVRVKDPDPLRKLDRSIPKDLETICLKCLAKERKDRYVSAQRLSNELDRWLRGEPIEARPISAAERGWRWAKRNTIVASLIGAMFVILAIAAVSSMFAASYFATLQSATAKALADARDQEHRAEEALKKHQTVEEARKQAESKRQQAEAGRQLAMKQVAEVSKGRTDAEQARADLEKSVQGAETKTQSALADRDRVLGTVSFSHYRETFARAAHAWEEGKVELARRLLDECPPQHRGYEWSCLQQLVENQDIRFGQTTTQNPITCIEFTPDSQSMAFAVADEIQIWDLAANARRKTLKDAGQRIETIVFNGGGDSLISSGRAYDPAAKPTEKRTTQRVTFQEQKCTIWDSGTGETRSVFKGKGPIRGIGVDQNGDLVAVTGGPPPSVTLTLWNAFTHERKEMIKMSVPGEHSYSVLLGPDGRTLAVPGSRLQHPSTGMSLWDTGTGEEILSEGASMTGTPAFSRDGKLFTTGNGIWDVTTKSIVRRRSLGNVRKAFSADNKFLVGNARTGIQILDSSRSETIFVPLVQNDSCSVTAVAFSPDGKAAMKQLDGSFVRTTREHSETAVEFHNPSIKDYVRKRIVSDTDVRMELLRKALFFEQVSCLVRLSAAGQVGPEPNGLVLDDATLHGAIERTLDAKAATYHQYGADGKRRLIRMSADVGARLTEVTNWAKSYRSMALLPLTCRIAADMVASGDSAKAATLNSCGFLDAVVTAYPDSEQTTSVVRPFLAHIDEHLSETPSAAGWTLWTNFLKANEALFDEEEMNEWAQRAESFCTDEIHTITENAETSSQAQEWYDKVASVAESWDVSLESERQSFDDWLGELIRREEGPDRDDDDWRGTRSADRMTGGDEEIDRLFESLNDKVDE